MMWRNYPTYLAATAVTRLLRYRVFSSRTAKLMRFDLARMRARARMRRLPREPGSTRLHVGCGSRIIPGWVNADVVSKDTPVDLAAPLPWAAGSFDTVVGEHVIEHLEIEAEAVPFLRELHRVSRSGAIVWLSTPDIEKIVKSYVESRGLSLIDSWCARNKGRTSPVGRLPSVQMINRSFHQSGEHKNLFDFELLAWALREAGFSDCVRVVEADLLDAHPDVPRRGDDAHTLYVRAERVPDQLA